VQEGTQEETTAVVSVEQKIGPPRGRKGGRPFGTKNLPKMRYKHISAPYDFSFVQTAERLKAAGLSDDDILYVFGLGDIRDLKRWKTDSPEFKKACESGKTIAVQTLLAQSFRMSKGYNYEETTEKYIRDKTDPKGKLRLAHRYVYKRCQPPDGNQLQMLLGALDKRFRQSKLAGVEIAQQQNINIGSIRFDGTLDSKRIEQLANRLLPKNTEDNERKLVVSTEAGR